MKNLKQLVLPCYKLEMAMSVEAWYFLHGSTDGICNLTYLLSLLSKMTVSEVQSTKRGLGYAVHPGQVDSSMLVLAKEWGIWRKAVSRLLEDFSERGLIRVDSNPVTSIIDMVCVKSWMIARAAHRESGIPPDNQGIRRGTDFPFQRATIRDLAPQFGKEEERKTDRRNGRGNGWLTVHESDRFQSYYRRYRNSGNRNGSNNRKRSGKHCGKCRCGCRQHTCFRGWQYSVRLTEMETSTGMKRQKWQATAF